MIINEKILVHENVIRLKGVIEREIVSYIRNFQVRYN